MAIVSDLQTLHGFTGPTYQPFSTKNQRQDQRSYRVLKCTHSPKFASSFANFSCSLLSHHLWRGGSMTTDTAALGARANLGLIQRACKSVWAGMYLPTSSTGIQLTFLMNSPYDPEFMSLARAPRKWRRSVGTPSVQCYMRVRRTWTLVLIREGIEVE